MVDPSQRKVSTDKVVPITVESRRKESTDKSQPEASFPQNRKESVVQIKREIEREPSKAAREFAKPIPKPVEKELPKSILKDPSKQSVLSAPKPPPPPAPPMAPPLPPPLPQSKGTPLIGEWDFVFVSEYSLMCDEIFFYLKTTILLCLFKNK